MNTEQATLLLASLVRTQRRFQSYDVNNPSRERIDAVQELLQEFKKQLADALTTLEKAYRLVGAEPPPATPADLENGRHPVMLAIAKVDPLAEMTAWRMFLSEMFEK
jgi:hypothetical protein